MAEAQGSAVLDAGALLDFRRSVREFVEDTLPLSVTRRYVEDPGAGYDAAAWRRALRELDVVAAVVPEALGGQGFGLQLGAVVFEEFGRVLAPGPLLGTLGLATSVLVATGSGAAATLLGTLLDGSRTATVGWMGEPRSWDPARTGVTARSGAGGVRLSGQAHQVVDGDVADVLLLAARTDSAADPIVLAAVDAGAAGMSVGAVHSLDLTRRFATVSLDATPARVIEGAGTQQIRAGLLSATALIGAESTGGARHALELAVEYAKVRHQFGRPIGSFQAIKHMCADMLARVELMSAITAEAVAAVDAQTPGAATVTSAAKAYASDAFFEVASAAVQVHGGIGFTWEHDAHLFFRRAKGSDLFLGDSAEHRELIAHYEGWRL